MSNCNSDASLLLDLTGLVNDMVSLESTLPKSALVCFFSCEVIVLYLIFWRHADLCPQLLLSSTHSIFTAFEWLIFRSLSEVTTDEFVHCKCQTCVCSFIYLFERSSTAPHL